MEFTKRNIDKTNRNGSQYYRTTAVVKSGGKDIPLAFLPAVDNGDGTYTVDSTKVFFTGNLAAGKEVTAYGVPEGEGGGGGDKPGTIIIDKEFSDKSENPLQNKVITLALGDVKTLTTKDKTVVGAINEIKEKGGSGSMPALPDKEQAFVAKHDKQSGKDLWQALADELTGYAKTDGSNVSGAWPGLSIGGKVNNHTVNADVPKNAKFTDTTYEYAWGYGDTYKGGLMSASDKKKLDSIEYGATSSSYSLPTANTTTLGGVKTGYTSSGKNYAVNVDSDGNAYVYVSWSDTTYNNATTSSSGLMSSTDKSRLDTIHSNYVKKDGTNASGTWSINISGNAKSATRLQTPRTIWGQSFDGFSNVNGSISFDKKDSHNIGTADTGARNVYTHWVASPTAIPLILGASNGEAIYISTSQNVGVGGSANESYKLTVHGNTKSTNTYCNWVGSAEGSQFSLGANNSVAMRFGLDNEIFISKDTWISNESGIGILRMVSSSYETQLGASVASAQVTVRSGKLKVNGNILAAGEVTAYSDMRLKKDISPLSNRGYVTPVMYTKDGKRSIGFLAQNVRDLYPELVSEDNSANHFLHLNYQQYTAVLQAQIIELNNRLEELERSMK